MPRTSVDFDTVRKLAREFGEVQEASGPRGQSLKAHGKLLAWTPIHKSAEPRSLAVSIAIQNREELIEAAPEIYYVTDHYLNYPTVLIRLDRIRPDALKDLLHASWNFTAAKSARRKPPSSR